MIGLLEERGPELGQMGKQARISKLEIRPFNESFADSIILRLGLPALNPSRTWSRWLGDHIGDCRRARVVLRFDRTPDIGK